MHRPLKVNIYLARLILRVIVPVTLLIAQMTQLARRAWLVSCLICAMGLAASPSFAWTRASDAMQFWVDLEGSATVEDVMRLPITSLQPLSGAKFQQLSKNGAIWLRYEIPQLDSEQAWYFKFEGPAFTNRAELFQPNAAGQWTTQLAGDHVPHAQWSRPSTVPYFKLQARAQDVVWLRVQEYPSPSRPTISLMDEGEYTSEQLKTLLLTGGYLGFCCLVFYMGLIYWRMFRDRIFLAYVGYVGTMVGLQLCFTGVGQAVLWRSAGSWNDLIAAFSGAWVMVSGLWFVRQLISLQRLSPILDHLTKLWCYVGFVAPFIYALSMGPSTLKMLNLFALITILVSVAIKILAWRRGEMYGKYALLAFLPLHLSYIFPGLRLAGVMQDGFITQFSFLLGSAIEIPALLYLLQRRAKDFSENTARMQSVRTTDALTGLPILPVLELRLGDAIARAQRQDSTCVFMIIELQNHAQIVAKTGRLSGEQALVHMAAKLRSCVRPIDTVCRLSDTRMGIVLEPPISNFKINDIAQSIVTKGLMKTSVGTVELRHTYCIGVMEFSGQSLDMKSDESASERVLALPNDVDANAIISEAHTQLDLVRATSSRKIFKLPLSAEDLASFDALKVTPVDYASDYV